jgi:predicted nuclease with TOPRIM domain
LFNGIQVHGLNLERLEQEHVELGLKLSQVLRDKAEAEETKKRLNDYMMRAKSRIKEIEQKLSE